MVVSAIDNLNKGSSGQAIQNANLMLGLDETAGLDAGAGFPVGGAMKGLKKQRRIQIIAVAAVALALSTALIGYAMQDGINFFRAPAQVVAEPPGPERGFPDRRAGRGGHAGARSG